MCKCCEDLKMMREADKDAPINIRYETKATLTSFSYRKGFKKPTGTMSFGSYKINYCPMCGRKLNKEK